MHVITKDDVVLPIILKIKKVEKNGSTYEIEDKLYLAEINKLFQDCQDNLELNKVSLINKSFEQQSSVLKSVVKNYSNCKQVPTTTFDKHQGPKAKGRKIFFAAYLGVDFNKMKITTINNVMSRSKYTNEPTITGGVNLIYFFSPVRQTWSVLTGFQYQSARCTGHYENPSRFQYDSEIEFTAVKIPLALQYRHGMGKYGVFMRLGMQAFLATNRTFSITETSPFSGISITSVTEYTHRPTFMYLTSIGGERSISKSMSVFINLTYDGDGVVFLSKEIDISQHSMSLTAGLRF
jgi:hypothetical protein